MLIACCKRKSKCGINLWEFNLPETPCLSTCTHGSLTVAIIDKLHSPFSQLSVVSVSQLITAWNWYYNIIKAVASHGARDVWAVRLLYTKFAKTSVLDEKVEMTSAMSALS